MLPHLLGIIENMSGFICPSCNEVHDIFGTGQAFERAAERVAGRLSVEAAKIPRKPTIMLKTVRSGTPNRAEVANRPSQPVSEGHGPGRRSRDLDL